MAAVHFSTCARTKLRTPLLPLSPHKKNKKTFRFLYTEQQQQVIGNIDGSSRIKTSLELRVSSGDSYLDMWKKSMDQERKEFEFQKIVDNKETCDGDGDGDDGDALERKSEQFMKILEVPKEERDRVQRMQVIDRAAAAIAAAQALINESPPPAKVVSNDSVSERLLPNNGNGARRIEEGGMRNGDSPISLSRISGSSAPGPDFWSWTPPLDDSTTSEDLSNLKMAGKPSSSPSPINIVIDKEQSIEFLPIPFESTLLGSHNPPLPPLQSLMEVGNVDASNSKVELPIVVDRHELDLLSSVNAAVAAEALGKVDEALPYGVNPDGSKWWKETGVERRPDGVVCHWTLTRGVSADKSVEWEEKYWEAADNFDYKELGSEKSGRDAAGNVWREYWRESMWQDLGSGLIHMEKTADKWGKNGQGAEWQEKWWEHYDASGQADKWAHKWCSTDPNTPLEAGHAHVWHERWGEKYDGQGGSIKYTDKWAERLEGDGWSKWGDKWDENFNQYGHGVKQGETWWQGKYGERWNRTWGERHNGSGWVHKYGKSSCGEHWDTHVQQDTWYERYPHFGFQHCLENSVQLQEVRKPSET